MKKLVIITFILSVVIGIGTVQVDISHAQETSNIYSFDALAASDILMRGPFASGRVIFGLPADWKLESGVEIQLDLTTFYGGVGLLPDPEENTKVGHGLGGSLEVSFNGQLVDSVLLNEVGARTVTAHIPAVAFESTRRDGLFEVSFFLDAALDCDFDQQTLVVVESTSRLVLPHSSITPNVDLITLPRPIYQATFQEETAAIVIPDQPTTGELQAALAVSAGFGQMTGGNLLFTYVTASQLTDEMRGANHLIFVGLPDKFQALNSASLPAPISSGSYTAEGALPDDGIIQMVASPWNPAKVVLVVGGNTDAGIAKAGQATSTGAIRTGNLPNLAVIESVQPFEFVNFTGIDRTLADLGYQDVTETDYGVSSVEFLLFVPTGSTIGPDSYFNLSFSNSTLLDYARSGLVVSINDQPIGSVRLGDDTASNGEARMSIPPALVRPGINQISIEMDLIPTTVCLDPRLDRLWVRIDSGSLFHMPLIPITSNFSAPVNLNQYPEPFSLDPLWSSLAFVLSPQDSSSWITAMQIAADLGNRSNISLANHNVSFADNVPDEIRKTRDLIIVGRPSTLAILGELSDDLPAYFEPNSDLAIEKNLQVSYRLLPGVSAGYLEFLSAPWDAQRTILAVSGSTDEGLLWASTALTTPALRGRLFGDLAVINRSQVVATDTREYSTSSVLAAAVPAGVAEVPEPSAGFEQYDVTQYQQPNWILPTLAGVVIIMLVVVVIAMIRGIRRGRASV